MEQRKPIQRMDPLVAERIAAGEVIERPSSVVKELVENAIDAGATEISVRLENGGRDLIEVLDNGSGIPAEEIPLALERHATSKIRTFEDLNSLLSLGFRGEALPSIAAVARLSILSRVAEARDAYLLSPGQSSSEPHTFGHFLGAPHGTRIRVEGLFSEIPARLKFLKGAGAEAASVRDWIERLSLAYPHIGMSVHSQGRLLFQVRPQSLEERIRVVLAQGEDYPIVQSERMSSLLKEENVQIRIHWVQGLSLPSGKRMIQIVNGRILKDRVLQQALLKAFKQALLPGQYPALLLKIDLPPSEVDMNVHPTKTEARFLNQNSIFSRVLEVTQNAIEDHGAMGWISAAPRSESPSFSTTTSFTSKEHQPFFFPRTQASPTFTSETLSTEKEDAPAIVHADEPGKDPFQGLEYQGTLFRTYLVFEEGQELVLIDQHAADERIRFERLKKTTHFERQTLLLPEAITFNPEDRAAVEREISRLEKIGFDVEVFGEKSVVFRAIPTFWGMHSLRPRLKNLLERLLEGDPSDDLKVDEVFFEKIASEACHSAVRAGDRLSREEALALKSQLFQTEHPWNCPHGRPTIVRIPQSRFEEWFQRRVPH